MDGRLKVRKSSCGWDPPREGRLLFYRQLTLVKSMRQYSGPHIQKQIPDFSWRVIKRNMF